MTPQTSFLCIGGPLDGKQWPSEHPPTVQLPSVVPDCVPIEQPSDTETVIDRVRYEARTLRQPFGDLVTLFVDDRITDVELRAELNRRYPNGLS